MIVELIPYNNFKEKLQIIKEQLKMKRQIEVWDKYIYSIGGIDEKI